jgi:hypothetical protein
MTGLESVKRELEMVRAVAFGNYHHEQKGERIDDLALNRLFVGRFAPMVSPVFGGA